MEAQFKDEYSKLRAQVQELASGLVDHARTSYELEVILNHNPSGEPWKPGRNLKSIFALKKKTVSTKSTCSKVWKTLIQRSSELQKGRIP